MITNTNSSTVIDTHLLIAVQGISRRFRLANASGTTAAGEPYIRVFMPNGVLEPGQSISQPLNFTRQGEEGGRAEGRPVPVNLNLLSGQGNP
jgi:hypothetical protein